MSRVTTYLIFPPPSSFTILSAPPQHRPLFLASRLAFFPSGRED